MVMMFMYVTFSLENVTDLHSNLGQSYIPRHITGRMERNHSFNCPGPSATYTSVEYDLS